MRHVKLEVEPAGIAILTLDHAGESMNLVTPEWIEEMNGAIERVAVDQNVTGLIITSAKSTFLAGADLNYLIEAAGRMSVTDAREFSRRASLMHRRLETTGKPVVAALNGTALGGGLELALSCHHRILVDDSKVVVGLPEVNVGLLPGSGGTQRLIRMIGVKPGLDLLLTGKRLKPAEAVSLGIVDRLVSAPELIETARAWLLGAPGAVRAWDQKGFSIRESAGLLDPANATLFNSEAARLAAHGRNYPAPIAILSSVFEGAQVPFDKALEVESRYFASLLTGPVARNIIRTNFVSRGAAEKLSRRPVGIGKVQFDRVGVVGAGLMGAGIAYAAAKAGMEVCLLDVTLKDAEAALERLSKALEKQISRGQLTASAAKGITDRIRPTSDFAELSRTELVVEAVFEDFGVKAEVTAKVEAVVGSDAILATNTSTLPISDLAGASSRPGNFIGLHFFSPVERMPLVEVIRGRQTTDETLARSLDFVAQLRKTPIVVNDSRGFFTSRVFQTFIHEGAAMLGEGVAPSLIENAAKAAGMPIGPLALLDEVTVNLPLKIVEQSIDALGSSYDPPCGTAVMTRMRELGRSGRKAGAGFYDYPPEARKHLWRGLGGVFPRREIQPDLAELKDRFLLIQALEAARCLEEGVITNPVDGDLGSVLGWGFPAWTGGALSLIDTLGLNVFVSRCDTLARAFGNRFQPSNWLREREAAGQSFYPAPVSVACERAA